MSLHPTPVAQPEHADTVTGTVESIVYRNDETGYTVCTVKISGERNAREEFVTVVGNCAAMWEGEELHAEGGRGFAKIREGMRRAMNSIPNGGMAVTFDLGNPKDIHPKEKLHVGERLAQWALHNDYGFKDVVPSGPDYKSMKVEGDKARLSFDYVGSGLAVQDGRLG